MEGKMELADVKIGSQGELKVELVGGNLKITGGSLSSEVEVSASVVVHPDVLIDKLAALIPGKIDDAIFGVLKVALKAS